MFLSTESKTFEFEITESGQSAEFSLNCNICFFYKRDSGAIPVFIYIFIYIIILLVFLILLFSTNLLINLITWKAIIRFFTLVLSDLFIWISFFPNEWQRIKKLSINIKNLSNTNSNYIKQTYKLKNLLKFLNSSMNCLKSLKIRLAATTTMFMISTRSRLINKTYQLAVLTYHLWPLTHMN